MQGSCFCGSVLGPYSQLYSETFRTTSTINVNVAILFNCIWQMDWKIDRKCTATLTLCKADWICIFRHLCESCTRWPQVFLVISFSPGWTHSLPEATVKWNKRRLRSACVFNPPHLEVAFKTRCWLGSISAHVTVWLHQHPRGIRKTICQCDEFAVMEERRGKSNQSSSSAAAAWMYNSLFFCDEGQWHPD